MKCIKINKISIDIKKTLILQFKIEIENIKMGKTKMLITIILSQLC